MMNLTNRVEVASHDRHATSILDGRHLHALNWASWYLALGRVIVGWAPNGEGAPIVDRSTTTRTTRDSMTQIIVRAVTFNGWLIRVPGMRAGLVIGRRRYVYEPTVAQLTEQYLDWQGRQS